MRVDVKKEIYDLVSNNFDNTSVSGSPDIDVHTGWYNKDSSFPQITVTNPDFFTIGGGQTGNLLGKKKMFSGVVLINCASTRKENLENPKLVIQEMSELVTDIIENNRLSVSGVEEVGEYTEREIVDDEENPPWFRREKEIGAIVVQD